MNKIVKDRLYSARWAVSSAIETEDMSRVDYAMDQLIQAKADSITEDVLDIEPVVERPKIIKPDPIIKIAKSPSKVKVRGNFQTEDGMFDTICIHFHAGNENESSRKDADQMLAYLGSKGLGCLALDHDGTYYEPSNMSYLTQWGSNIGVSRFEGRTSLSRYACGIEVINSGPLIKWGSGFYPWYAFKYSGNKPIALKPGYKPHPSPRIIATAKDNHTVGAWDPFTEAQESALLDFCVKHIRMIPNLTVDRVRGHDELAWPRGRKSDPGGSLSVTMPEFRKKLAEIL